MFQSARLGYYDNTSLLVLPVEAYHRHTASHATVAPRMMAPRTMAPRTMASRTMASRMMAPRTMASRMMASRIPHDGPRTRHGATDGKAAGLGAGLSKVKAEQVGGGIDGQTAVLGLGEPMGCTAGQGRVQGDGHRSRGGGVGQAGCQTDATRELVADRGRPWLSMRYVICNRWIT